MARTRRRRARYSVALRRASYITGRPVYSAPPIIRSLPALPRSVKRAMITTIRREEQRRTRKVRKLKEVLAYSLARPGQATVSCFRLTPTQQEFGAGRGSGGRRRSATQIKRAAIVMERMQQRRC